jgi:hypothetical protein
MKKKLIVGSVIALGISILPTVATASEAPLTLATASTYGVLANTTVTSATASTITGTAGGDIGVSGGTAPTGSITFTGAQVLAGASIASMTSASTALADSRGGTATVVELGAGRIMTPGAYTGGALEINGALTFDAVGNANAVFIIRAATTLTTGSSSTVSLINGAQACNVYWQVGTSAVLGTSSTIVGHVIALTSISTGLGSVVNGQLIATTGAVTLGGTTITNNSCAAPAVAVVVETGTVHVIKKVENSFSGIAVASDFTVHVTHFGNEVIGSPALGMASPGRTYVLPVGTYLLSEDSVAGYWGYWDGDITRGGGIEVTKGSNLVVTRINMDIRSAQVVDATPTPTASPTTTPSPEPTTETGGVLPDTSTPIGNQALLGFGALILGALGLATRKILVK